MKMGCPLSRKRWSPSLRVSGHEVVQMPYGVLVLSVVSPPR